MGGELQQVHWTPNPGSPHRGFPAPSPASLSANIVLTVSLKGTPGGQQQIPAEKAGAQRSVLEEEDFDLPWPPLPVSESPQDSLK